MCDKVCASVHFFKDPLRVSLAFSTVGSAQLFEGIFEGNCMFANRSEQLTLIGAIMVAVGAFAPMVEVARLGAVSYADASGNEVYMLIAASLAAAGLIVAGKKQFSIFAVLVADAETFRIR